MPRASLGDEERKINKTINIRAPTEFLVSLFGGG